VSKPKKIHRRESRFVCVVLVHISTLRDALDMMRYDCCYPATEDESRKLYRLSDISMSRNDRKPTDHLVQFICVSRTENTPTVRRWSSFGCTVFCVRSPSDPLLSDEELLATWRERRGSAAGSS